MHKTLLVTTCALALATGAARAQQTAQLEEIVVTARKQAERLQDIPLTVTAFSEATIESAGLKNLADLQGLTPGLNFWQNVDRGYAQIMFRGMNNAVPTGDTSREAASVFLDGVYFVGNVGVLNFDDMERVEVVKGPQSAFFGRATFGGAINFVSKTPADTFQGKVKIRAAQDNDYEGGISAEGPLVEGRLRARASVDYRYFGGQYVNPLNNNKPVGLQRDTNGTATLYFTPADTLTVKGRFMYQHNHDGSAASALIGELPDHNCGPFGGTNNGSPATLYCGVLRYTKGNSVPLNENTTGAARAASGNEFGLRRNFYFGSLSADYGFADGWSLASLSGYSSENQRQLFDFERTGLDTYGAYIYRKQKAFSQELRLSTPQDWRLRGLLGAYYLWQNYETGGAFIYGSQNPVLAIFRIPAGSLAVQTPNAKVIRDIAVFGAMSYSVTDNLTASVEGRWQRDKVTSITPGVQIPSVTKSFLPRFILDYKPQPGTTLYANVSKGTKPTQANQDVALQTPANQAILAQQQAYPTAPEERIWNYEIGAKSSFWDNRAFVDVAVYYAQWRGKQGVKGVQVDLNGNGIIDLSATGVNREQYNAVVYPAGDVNIYGVEATFAAQLTPEFNLGGSIAYNGNDVIKLEDDLYRRFFGTLNAAGKEEPRVAKWSGSANLTYKAPLTGDINWFFRADEIFLGSRWASILDKTKTGDMWKTNLKLGIENGRWNVTAFVDNLFNNKTLQSFQQQGDSALDPFTFRLVAYEVVLPRLRQFGVTASYSF
jgi:iron complex outermembrane receptor protein